MSRFSKKKRGETSVAPKRTQPKTLRNTASRSSILVVAVFSTLCAASLVSLATYALSPVPP